MSRTFERLTFFILGGIFVSVGYLLGGDDTRAAPEENIAEFDTIHCKKLIVHDGNPEERKIYLGFGEDGESELFLSTSAENGRNAAIYLSASDEGPFLDIWGDTRESGTISLRCNDTGAILQISTLDREVEIEDNIEEEIKNDSSGVIIETTAEASSLMIEEEMVVSGKRQIVLDAIEIESEPQQR